MGVMEFFIFAIIVVLMGWFSIYALGKIAPGHPTEIDNIIWFVVVLIILVMLARATGLIGYDPQIPRIR